MSSLVSLDEAKGWLKLSGTTHEDESIQSCLDAAHELCLNYVRQRINGNDDGWQDTVAEWDEDTVPATVRKAIEIMTINLWRFRGDDVDRPQLDYGYMPKEVTWLLYRLKDPALS